VVHETPDDLRELQKLLDLSHARGGAHLRSIFTEERRIGAERLVELLTGVQILSVATVTAAGEPRVAPVDGLFYRGRWHFGSSRESVRFRHLQRRPQVSAAHIRGEELAVIVHGTAAMVDPSAAEHEGFRAYLLEVYGRDWASWAGDAPYASIEPSRMYTFAFGLD
jgi:uncharacterized pyridoxamine 5'-phosphate oxidase family protein